MIVCIRFIGLQLIHCVSCTCNQYLYFNDLFIFGTLCGCHKKKQSPMIRLQFAYVVFISRGQDNQESVKFSLTH